MIDSTMEGGGFFDPRKSDIVKDMVLRDCQFQSLEVAPQTLHRFLQEPHEAIINLHMRPHYYEFNIVVVDVRLLE